MNTDLIGLAAGTITTVSFLPQLVRLYRLKSGRDISGWMMSLFSLGVFLWFIYGVLLNAWPLIIANGITLIIALAILALKRRYARLSN